jgi:hypothetical protein
MFFALYSALDNRLSACTVARVSARRLQRDAVNPGSNENRAGERRDRREIVAGRI